MLPLDPAAATPLFRQLYDGLRRGILDGTLAPGVRLPATRSLAGELGVSRNTVLNAYEQLLAEGYLVVEHRITEDGTEAVAAALRELTDGFAGLVLTVIPQWTVVVLWAFTAVNGLFLLASIAFSARAALTAQR